MYNTAIADAVERGRQKILKCFAWKFHWLALQKSKKIQVVLLLMQTAMRKKVLKNHSLNHEKVRYISDDRATVGSMQLCLSK